MMLGKRVTRKSIEEKITRDPVRPNLAEGSSFSPQPEGFSKKRPAILKLRTALAANSFPPIRAAQGKDPRTWLIPYQNQVTHGPVIKCLSVIFRASSHVSRSCLCADSCLPTAKYLYSLPLLRKKMEVSSGSTIATVLCHALALLRPSIAASRTSLPDCLRKSSTFLPVPASPSLI